MSGVGLIRSGLRRHRRLLALGFPFIMAWHLCETAVPIVIGLVIDRGIAGGEVDRFVPALGLVVLLFLVLATSYRVGSRFIVEAIETEQHLLRTQVAGHVLDRRGVATPLLSGEILSIATSDAALVPTVFRQLAFAVAATTSLVAVAVYLLVIDLVLGLTIVIGVPTVVVAIQVATPLVARRTHAQQERTADATGLATDLVQGMRPLKGIGGERAASDRYRLASGRAAEATVSLARSWGYLAGLTAGLSGLLLAAVVLLAGTRALSGDITLGQLIAVVGLTQFLAEPIKQLGDVSAEFARSRASAQRIADFLARPRLVAAGDAEPAGSPLPLHLRAVAAGPIRSVDLETADGEVLAVVVEDPATSDALVAVLAGSRPIEAGTARLGRAPLDRLSIDARRRSLVVTGHHTAVLEGTLRQVVDPGSRLDPHALTAVLDASAATDVVDLHPDGLDRLVRAEGTTLSGGQRQRLVLARALAADPPLLVLQDPTSAVDAVTEQTIAVGMTALRRRPGRSTVVMTSSPALLRAADRVAHLRDGRVVATGTHTALMDDAAYRSAVLR